MKQQTSISIKFHTLRIGDVIRFLPQYQIWKRNVLIRDKHKCVLCGQKNGRLQVDHYPIPLSAIIRQYGIRTLEGAVRCKLLWKLGNGRTLCDDCHRRTNTYGRNAKKYKVKIKDIISI